MSACASVLGKILVLSTPDNVAWNSFAAVLVRAVVSLKGCLMRFVRCSVSEMRKVFSRVIYGQDYYSVATLGQTYTIFLNLALQYFCKFLRSPECHIVVLVMQQCSRNSDSD